MNWLVRMMEKTSGRSFKAGDPVRFFTAPRKGRGKQVVLAPVYRKGRVLGYDRDTNRYTIGTEEGREYIHPRNVFPDKRR